METKEETKEESILERVLRLAVSRSIIREVLRRAGSKCTGQHSSEVPDSLGDRIVRTDIAIGCLWMPGTPADKEKELMDEAHRLIGEASKLQIKK